MPADHGSDLSGAARRCLQRALSAAVPAVFRIIPADKVMLLLRRIRCCSGQLAVLSGGEKRDDAENGSRRRDDGKVDEIPDGSGRSSTLAIIS